MLSEAAKATVSTTCKVEGQSCMNKYQTWVLVVIGSAIGAWLGLHYSPF